MIDVIYDADGNPAAAIINVGPDLDQGNKDVSTPPDAVSTSADRVMIARSKEQAQRGTGLVATSLPFITSISSLSLARTRDRHTPQRDHIDTLSKLYQA